jgi:hypothetical protein
MTTKTKKDPACAECSNKKSAHLVFPGACKFSLRKKSRPSMYDYERLEELLGLVGNHGPYYNEAIRLLRKFKRFVGPNS